MTALLDPILGTMGIVSDIVGVPGLGAAATILKGIKENCDRVVAHKVSSFHTSQVNDINSLYKDECRRLAQKVAKLNETLDENRKRLQGLELRACTDEIERRVWSDIFLKICNILRLRYPSDDLSEDICLGTMGIYRVIS